MSLTRIIYANDLPAGSPVVSYSRVSERAQAANGSLERQQAALIAIVLERGLVPRANFCGREYGKLSKPRLLLDEAIAAARRHRAGIIAWDLTLQRYTPLAFCSE
jgi:hypothetical protein